MSYIDDITTWFELDMTVRRSMLKGAIPGQLEMLAKAMVQCYRGGKKTVWFGNGGSAADAQHFAAELSGRFYLDRSPLNALSLSVNTSALTAIGNDYGYDTVFERQVRGMASEGDVVIGISTSGTSPNVIAALDAAKELGAVTALLAGKGGSVHNQNYHHVICVPSTDTPQIQQGHLNMGHVLCYLVEKELFGTK